jgi:penicillin amidase
MTPIHTLRRAFAPLALACALLPGGAIAASLDGLPDGASIDYDAEGIPRLHGRDELQAAWLLGFVHARDRLFQMDLNRRTAQGRVAELMGPAALPNDVQTRTLGLDRAAAKSWRALSPDTRAWLQQYALGVNASVARHGLPREYAMLETTRFEPWSPLDSVAVTKLLSFQLSFTLDIDFTLRLAAYQKAGIERGFDGTALFFEDTHRSQPADGRISYPDMATPSAKHGDAGNDFAFGYDESTLALARAYRAQVAAHPLIAPTLDQVNNRGGSNTWVIGGQHTASGKPILANDPHLNLPIPNTFYEARVIGGDTLDVTGIGMPGMPALAFGCTPRACWGITTAHMDVTDTYEETLVVNSYGLPTHTVYQGVAEPLEWVFQSYRVNRLDGVADNAQYDPSIGYTNGGMTLVVPRRNHGPIVTLAGGKGLSVQYTGWGATYEIEGLRRMNRARNVDDMRDAASYVDFGAVNASYADVDGHIAMFATGEQPLRDDLQNLERPDGAPPFLIRDGSGARRHEWVPLQQRQPNQALPYEILRADEMPHAIDPPSGYLANANNDPLGNTLDNTVVNDRRRGGGLRYLAPYYSTFRMGRIDRLIEAALARGDVLDFETVRDWQANTQQLDAELFLPHLFGAGERAARVDAWAPLRALATDARVGEALQRLRGWDFSAPTGIRAGFDAGDDPAALSEPSAEEIAHSVAATIYAGWRAQTVRTVIDGTLQRSGVVAATPAGAGSASGLRELLSALHFHLERFAQRRGFGVSGVDFFAVADAPTREDARDYVLMKALKDALDRFASDEFAPAFAKSTRLDDYRWGRLHRITLRHALRGPFDLPSGDALHGFANLAPELPGVARDGGYETLNDGEHDIRAAGLNGFTFSSGVIYRLVAEMLPQIRAEEILPGGQSADLTSPHYANQHGRWLTNRYRAMPLHDASSRSGQADDAAH